jgi:outer membrane protein assembly factor BamB
MKNPAMALFAICLITSMVLPLLQITNAQTTEGQTTYPWSQYQGDSGRTSFNSGPGPKTNNTLWESIKMNDTACLSMVVAEGKVFATTLHHGGFYCFNETTGDLIWSVPTHGEGNSATYGNGAIVICGGGTTLENSIIGLSGSPGNDAGLTNTYNCLNATTGKLIWSYNSGFSFGPANYYDGRFYLPGLYITGTTTPFSALYPMSTNVTACVLALDSVTGQLLQTYSTAYSPALGMSSGTPLGFGGIQGISIDNGFIYAGGTNTEYCWDIKTGQLLWNSTQGGTKPYYSGFAVDDTNVYCVGYYPPWGFFALDKTTGLRNWYVNTTGYTSNVACAYGNVYGASSDGTMYCIKGSTGQVIWTYKLAANPGGCMAVANGIVYIGTVFGNDTNSYLVYAVDANTGTLVWKAGPFDSALTGGGPAVADGLLFMGSNRGEIVCFGTLAAAASPINNYLVVILAVVIVVVAISVGTLVYRKRRRKPE